MTKPHLSAIIQRWEYLNILRSRSYVALIYDTSKLRDADNPNPTARFRFVDMLGPFRTMDMARRALTKAGVEGRS
jgi:hypothetical protein